MAAVYRVKRLGQSCFVVQSRPPWWATMFGLIGYSMAYPSYFYPTEEEAYERMAQLMLGDGYTDDEIEEATGVKP